MANIQGYSGTYSSNNIPKPTVFPSYFIVNFSKTFEVGTHFITLTFEKTHNLIYFDPLDLPIQQDILRYITEYEGDVYKINFQIQNPFSDFCGIFCMLIILLHANKLELNILDILFCKKSVDNDNIAKHTVVYLLKFYLDDAHV